MGLGGGGDAVVDGKLWRIFGGAGDGEGETIRGVVGERQVEVVWRCLRGGVLGYEVSRRGLDKIKKDVHGM